MAKRRGVHHPGGASLLYAPGEVEDIRADWTFPRHPTPFPRIAPALANPTCRYLERVKVDVERPALPENPC